MKLDTSHMRYVTSDDFRVLTAVEIGSKNHDVVPTHLIHQIGGLKSVSHTNRCISDLAKIKLISKVRNAKYDGYRLSYLGFDYLGLRAFLNRGSIYALGNQIGIGKESDIFSATDEHQAENVLKIHRLGRISFRTVKKNRDYLRNRHTSNWMYLSRLSAEKEYLFMTILHREGFAVPKPIDWSRHMVLMERIDGFPMRQLVDHANYKQLYSELMKFIVKLARQGLIHCDFNEFNIMIKDTGRDMVAKRHEGKVEKEKKRPEVLMNDESGTQFVVIDFPQCVSIDHVDAERYFDRDVDCIRLFFKKKFNYEPKDSSIYEDTDGFGEGYKYAYPKLSRDVTREGELDKEVEASGFTKKKAKELESVIAGSREEGEFGGESAEYDEQLKQEEEDEEEEEEEEGDDEDDDEEEEDEEDEDEEEDDDDEDEKLKEENEEIITILQKGIKELKMDKLGNYILE